MIFQPQIIGKPLPALTNPGTAADLLSGKQLIDANGNVLTGTMPTQGAQTITPGTTAKTIAAGRYLTGKQTIQGDADLVAGNIKNGVNIFGVAGDYNGDVHVTAKNFAIGYEPSTISDNGFDFIPQKIMVMCTKIDTTLYPDSSNKYILALYADKHADITSIVYTTGTSGDVRSSTNSFSSSIVMRDGYVSANASGLVGNGRWIGENQLIILG